MEGERRVQIVIAVIAAVLLAFAYGVGYYVGKGTGIEEEKKICEVQKRQLIKTLSRITPVSRPEPVEEKVVGTPPQEEGKKPELPTATAVVSKKKEVKEGAVSEKKEVKPGEKTKPQVVVSKEAVKSQPQAKVEKSTPPVAVNSVQKTETVNNPAKPEGAQFRGENRSGKKYYLQLGIFKNKANAVKLAEELNRKGFQAKTVFGKRYVKVIVGYFDSLHQARVVQKELRSAGFDSVLKWRKN